MLYCIYSTMMMQADRGRCAMKRKLFSMLFVPVMFITVIPFSAFAEKTDANRTEGYGDFIDGEQVIRDMIGKKE